MRFKIDWASLIVGRKFTVFSLFYLVFEGNFQVQASRGLGGGGGLMFGGAIQRRVFCVTSLGGLIFGGAYFRNFTVFPFPFLVYFYSNDVICLMWNKVVADLFLS